MADSGDGFFKGFLLGGIVGSIIGLLMAPKSGKELREQLSDETEKLLSKSKDDIENAKKAALHVFEKSMDKVIDKMREEKPVDKTEAKKTEKPAKVKKTPKRKTTGSKSKAK